MFLNFGIGTSISPPCNLFIIFQFYIKVSPPGCFWLDVIIYFHIEDSHQISGCFDENITMCRDLKLRLGLRYRLLLKTKFSSYPFRRENRFSWTLSRFLCWKQLGFTFLHLLIKAVLGYYWIEILERLGLDSRLLGLDIRFPKIRKCWWCYSLLIEIPWILMFY